VGLEERVIDLERKWELYEPMFSRLAEDQAYRARYREERNKSWAKWQRWSLFTFSAAGALAVVAAAISELVRLF
jgi:hypothetical protein